MSRFPAAAFAMIVVLAGAACDKSPTNPSPPKPNTPPTPAPPSLQSISVEGPALVVPGAHAQYAATGHISDGSTQDLTSTATWRSSDDGVLSIAPNGEVAGGKAGEVVLAAESDGKRANLQVLVLAPGTFKLSGIVSDSGIPIAGATVDVVNGSLAVASVRTDSDGIYRFYGLSGVIEVRVRASGYAEKKQEIPVTNNTTLDFPLPPGANLTGSYDLTITADSLCPTSTRDALPTELRVRTYQATIAQSGPQLSVKLGGAPLTFGSFTGTQNGAAVTFDIHGVTPSFFYYYNYFDKTLDLVEQLPQANYLIISGTATTSTVSSGLSGQLDGVMGVVPKITGSYVNFSNSCFGKQKFVLTRR